MPRQSKSVPKLRHHKPSGRGYVVLNGRTLYLGPYDDPDTWTRYRAIVATWENNGRKLPDDAAPSRASRFRPSAAEKIVATTGGYTVGHLIRDFLAYARDYHGKRPDGSIVANGEYASYKMLGRLLRQYADEPAINFGPRKLRAVREQMIAGNWVYKRGAEMVAAEAWSRTHANAMTNRLRRMFKWAVEHELVPVATLAALQAVEPLRRGKTTARESAKVRPVAEAHVEAVLPFLNRQIAAVVRLMWLTGMRPEEALGIRPCDLNTAGDVWLYSPATHKTMHHGHERVVPLGPQCQDIIRPFLDRRIDAPLFSPADADAERRAALHAKRKTPMSCGNKPGSNRKDKPARKPGAKYSPMSLYTAVMHACEKAFPAPDGLDAAEAKAWNKEHRFTPYQLRHAAGTRLRRETGGLETVQVMLGHQRASTTEIYAEPNVQAAVDVARKLG